MKHKHNAHHEHKCISKGAMSESSRAARIREHEDHMMTGGMGMERKPKIIKGHPGDAYPGGIYK